MDVSDIFYFFCPGEGKEESEAPGEGGVRFFIENPRRGGVSRAGGGGQGRGAGRVFAGNLGGGGAKYFFFGAEIPTKFRIQRILFLFAFFCVRAGEREEASEEVARARL